MNTKGTNILSIENVLDKTSNTLPQWSLSDIFIPRELKELIQINKPQNSLELGCGLGQFSSFMVKKGVKATGVDSSLEAIEMAKKRVTDDNLKPTFIVSDVTHLDTINERFDVSFDVGYFQCLHEEEQQQYVSRIAGLLKPGAVHLLWAIDGLLNDLKFSLEYIANAFGEEFQLVNSLFSRRRIMASHWYWLVRK